MIECTYNHFQSSPNCPSCGRLLGENDFTEVTISDPDSKISNDPNEIVQSLLTKTSKQLGTTIAWNDICAALIREHQVQEKNTRFFVNVSSMYHTLPSFEFDPYSNLQIKKLYLCSDYSILGFEFLPSTKL